LVLADLVGQVREGTGVGEVGGMGEFVELQVIEKLSLHLLSIAGVLLWHVWSIMFNILR
jgi:hypothetical protein